MKSVKNHYSLIIFTILGILAVYHTAAAQNALSPQDKKVYTEFERQVKEYSSLRERVEGKLPKLSKDATADQIEAHKKQFQGAVLAARAGAKQGDIFTTTASPVIRTVIKTEFSGKDGAELRKKVLEAETKGVPVRVNFAYPDSKEQVEMPPTLLLALPQLPKQLRYRFVGTNLLLVDRENGLIIDYMTNALP
jgi:hypothetical protein